MSSEEDVASVSTPSTSCILLMMSPSSFLTKEVEFNFLFHQHSHEMLSATTSWSCCFMSFSSDFLSWWALLIVALLVMITLETELSRVGDGGDEDVFCRDDTYFSVITQKLPLVSNSRPAFCVFTCQMLCFLLFSKYLI